MEKQCIIIDLVVLLNVLLAAIVLGAVAHEITHVFTISNPSEITMHWGADLTLSTCCLQEGEAAMELIAYAIQFITMVFWVALNREHILFRKNQIRI